MSDAPIDRAALAVWAAILAFLALFWGSVGILTYRIIVGA